MAILRSSRGRCVHDESSARLGLMTQRFAVDMRISRNTLLTAGVLEGQKVWVFLSSTNRDSGSSVPTDITPAEGVVMVEVTRTSHESGQGKNSKGTSKARDWLTLAIREVLSMCYVVFVPCVQFF